MVRDSGEETSLVRGGGDKVGLGGFGRLFKRFHNQNMFVVSPNSSAFVRQKRER